MEAAAAKANAILTGTDVVAWPSWRSPPAAPSPIPIFIVDDGSLAVSDLAFSPNGEACLFLSRRFLLRFVELFGQDGEATFDVPAEDALAIVLLHELGHFHNGDAGHYSPPVLITADELPVALAAAKSTELRADKFAGEQLAAASQAADARLVAALPVVVALDHITWNLEKVRLVDHLGATELGLASVLGDPGYSHPNLELRFLVIAYVSAPDRLKSRALQLVATFLDGRRPRPDALWKASPE